MFPRYFGSFPSCILIACVSVSGCATVHNMLQGTVPTPLPTRQTQPPPCSNQPMAAEAIKLQFCRGILEQNTLYTAQLIPGVPAVSEEQKACAHPLNFWNQAAFRHMLDKLATNRGAQKLPVKYKEFSAPNGITIHVAVLPNGFTFAQVQDGPTSFCGVWQVNKKVVKKSR